MLTPTLCLLLPLALQEPVPQGDVDPRAPLFEVPDLAALANEGGMRDVVERYRRDRGVLERFYDVRRSDTRRERLDALAASWRAALDGVDFEALDQTGRIDWLLLREELDYRRQRFELQAKEALETDPALPFAGAIASMQEGRRRLEPVDPEAAAEELVRLKEEIDAVRERVVAAGAEEEAEEPADDGALPIVLDRVTANRAAREARGLLGALESWYGYFAGYDPLFTWWCEQPYGELEEALDGYAKHLREEIAGLEEDDDTTIVGDPIGREALFVELGHEWIPYTPEELLEIAEREMAWCEERMRAASEALGFGDDWRAAQEHVKELHAEPGGQPELIRELALEAVDFLEARDLVTVPALAKNSWRMEMMSPARQEFSPYFTGGEVISVAFPTDGMSHEAKRMSLRGNNEHFSRAVVHHELIPGHHLQGFMRQRHKPWRGEFGTPFFGEGWALYWEMLLWDEGFPRGPEDEVGMLFWRKHRCARILFSLGFHLGELDPEECIDLLVERVGHERRNAAAEVRRSVQGGYPPLYQAAYMLGGLQLRSLHRELVGEKGWTNRAFHDACLREGSIPIELLRAGLTGADLTRDTRSTWRF